MGRRYPHSPNMDLQWADSNRRLRICASRSTVNTHAVPLIRAEETFRGVAQQAPAAATGCAVPNPGVDVPAYAAILLIRRDQRGNQELLGTPSLTFLSVL